MPCDGLRCWAASGVRFLCRLCHVQGGAVPTAQHDDATLSHMQVQARHVPAAFLTDVVYVPGLGRSLASNMVSCTDRMYRVPSSAAAALLASSLLCLSRPRADVHAFPLELRIDIGRCSSSVPYWGQQLYL